MGEVKDTIWIVTWLDAWHDPRPHIEVAELKPEPARTSVGFLVQDDDEYLYLAATLDSDGLVGEVLKIPKGCVVDTTEIAACGG
jgi:hypothetical protein